MGTSDRSHRDDGELTEVAHAEITAEPAAISPAVSNTEAARRAAEKRKAEEAALGIEAPREFVGDLPPPEHGGDDDQTAASTVATATDDDASSVRGRWAGLAGAPAPLAHQHEDEPLWIAPASFELGATLDGARDGMMWLCAPAREPATVSSTDASWWQPARDR